MNFSSVTGKKWIYKKYDSSIISNLVEKYSLTELTAKLLSIRKNNIDNYESFLNPKIKNLLPNPSLLKDMNVAIDRTYKSIINNDTIGIFGDYDVDGATSTALLARYFLSIKQKIRTHIPDRQKEGYGPSLKGFENLIRDTNSNAVINSSKSEYKIYMARYRSREQQSDELRNACKEINTLKAELREIKGLIKKVIDK